MTCTERCKARILLSILLFSFLVVPAAAAEGTRLEVVFFDVGEGEAALFSTPDGKNVLVDTGNIITGKRLVNRLKDLGIRVIDALFVTHPHPDHMGGVFHLLQDDELEVRKLYDNGQPIPENPPCDTYRWYRELARKGNYGTARRGDTFRFGPMEVKVLWPPSDLAADWNTNSLVLRVRFGDVSFLLAGDAGRAVEKKLMERGEALKADLLKVGHHGASDATGEDFLGAVAPRYAVISVNAGNIRGYPSAAVMERFAAGGIKTFTTHVDGDIIVRTDGRELEISFSR